jgi:hypothetical protein
MADTQFRVEDERYQQAPPPPRSNWLRGCLLGCLAVVVLFLILGVVATIWISRNWRAWTANTMSMAIKVSIDETGLPDAEKEQIKAEVDRGANLFRDGKISNEQAARLVETIMASPLMTALITSGAEKKYLDSSGLSDEEKSEAKVTLQRFARGIIDNKINQQTRDAAMQHISETQADGSRRLRDKVSDAELLAFLTDAKKAADEAQIPEQVPQIDPSDEVKRIIDEVTSEPAMGPPQIEVPPPAETPPEAKP